MFLEEIKKELINLVISNKILENRALILDLIADDYYQDSMIDLNEESEILIMNFDVNINKLLRTREVWMVNLVNDMIKVFYVESNHSTSRYLIENFLNAFFIGCEDIFIGIKQFKSLSNQLVLNFFYFDIIMSKYCKIDSDIVEKLHNNIESNRKIPLNKIRDFLRKNIMEQHDEYSLVFS